MTRREEIRDGIARAYSRGRRKIRSYRDAPEAQLAEDALAAGEAVAAIPGMLREDDVLLDDEIINQGGTTTWLK